MRKKDRMKKRLSLQILILILAMTCFFLLPGTDILGGTYVLIQKEQDSEADEEQNHAAGEESITVSEPSDEPENILEPVTEVEPKNTAETESSTMPEQEAVSDNAEHEVSFVEMPEAGQEQDFVYETFARRKLLNASEVSSAETEGVYELDGMKLNEVTIKWVTKSTGESVEAGTGDLNLVPNSTEVPNQKFQIDFSVEGQEAHDAGTIEIVIPAYIWLNRSGQPTGKLTLAVPEEPETGADFAWRRVGDLIYITNTHRLASASRVMIQGTFRDLYTLDLREVDIDGEDPRVSRWYENEPGLNGYSKWMNATVNVTTTHNNVITRESNQIRADINTQIQISSARKSSNLSYCYMDGSVESVPEQMQAVLTEKGLSADDYVFVRWYVTANASGLQPFTMKLEDLESTLTMTKADGTDISGGALLLGATGLTSYNFEEAKGETVTQGTIVTASDSSSVSAILYDGYTTAVRSAYVWAAYPKAKLSDTEYTTLGNTVTCSVEGQDDLLTSSQNASGTVKVKIPTYYHVKKNWDYSSIGSPDSLPDYIAQPSSASVTVSGGNLSSRTYTLNESNSWTGTWSNEGKEYNQNSYSIWENTFKPNVSDKTSIPDVVKDGVHYRLEYWYEESSPVYDEETKTFVITNVYKETMTPYTDYTVKKVWTVDAQGMSEIPTERIPSDVTVRVNYRNGNGYSYSEGSHSLSESNSWTYNWTDRGFGYTYSVSEDATTPNADNKASVADVVKDGVHYRLEYWYEESSPVYDEETKTFVITNVYKETMTPYTDYTVKKVWAVDAQGLTEIPTERKPSSVTASVNYRNGNGYSYSEGSHSLSESNSWTYDWTDRGFGYTYSVSEDTITPTASSKGTYDRDWYQEEGDGQRAHVEYWYTSSVSALNMDEEARKGSYTITNTYHETAVPIYHYTVVKNWDDTGSPSGSDLRPGSATVYVRSSGNSYSSHTFGNTDGESFSWDAYGRDGTFSLYENDGAKYYTTYQDEQGHWWRVRYWYGPSGSPVYDAENRTWTVTNRYYQDTPVPYTTHTFRKIWNDEGHEDRRPTTARYRVRVYDGSTLIRTDTYEVVYGDDSYTVKIYASSGTLKSETTYSLNDGVAEFEIPDEGYGYTYDIYEYSTSGSITWDEGSTTYRQQYWYSPNYGTESYSGSTYSYVRTITNTYSEGRAIPYTTHTVRKAWDYSAVNGKENVPSERIPGSTSFTVSPGGTYTLNGDQSEFSWVDQGYGYSYSVTERGINNGKVFTGSQVVDLEDGRQALQYYGYEVVYGAEDANHVRVITNRYFQYNVPFKYYSLEKIWGDNGNEHGHRAENQYVTITTRNSNGTVISTRTVNVGTNGELEYEWNDGGYGYSYSVSETNATRSGYTDWVIKEEGEFKNEGDTVKTPVKERVFWKYTPGTITSTVDENGDTKYTVNNLYSEQIERQWAVPLKPDELSAANTKTATDYTSRNKDADRQVNTLVRGEGVVVNYRVSGNANILQYTQAETKTRQDYVDYGVRPATVRLEDQPVRIFNFNSDSEEYLLTTDDYEIATVTLSPTSISRWTQADAFSTWYKTALDSTQIHTSLYGESADGTVLKYAELVGSSTISVSNGASVSGMAVTLPSGVKRVWTEFTTQDGRMDAYVSMSYDVGVRILPSSGILEQIDQAFENAAGTEVYAELRITNRSKTVASGTLDGERMEKESSAYSYIHGKDYRTAAGITTRLTYDGDADHDVIKHVETIHITDTFYQQSNVVNLSEYYTELDGGSNMVYSSNSGIWYDLLPVGLEPDMDTLAVSGGGEIKWKQAIPNYNGSGKTLVIARVEYPYEVRYTTDNASGLTGYSNRHTLTFEGKYTWDNIIAFKLMNGVTLYHTAVFQADEDEVGNVINYCGEPDDPYTGRNIFSETLTKGLGVDISTNTEDSTYAADAQTLTELDPSRDDPSFVYRRSSVLFDPDLAQVVAMEKLVSIDGINWVKGHADLATDESDPKAQKISVYEGAPYTYRITVAQQTNGWTNNIVLYDFLENYTLDHTDMAESYDGEGRWWGILESIDLTEIKNLGCAPVIYYTTEKDTTRSSNLFSGAEDANQKTIAPPPVTDTSFWSTEPPADLGQVTGIAIDCSKTGELEEDGSGDYKDFWLKEDDVLEVFIHMRSPLMNNTDRIERNEAGKDFIPKAYNNTAINYNIRNDGTTDGYHYYKTYTQIELKPYEVSVEKEWSDDQDRDGLRPKAIKFRVLRNGAETDTFVTLSADDGWRGEISSLPIYDESGRYITYTLKEEKWIIDENGTEKEIDPNPTYTMTQDSVSSEGSLEISVSNSHTPERINLPFEKTWTGDEPEDRPSQIQVKLLADGEYTGKTVTLKPDEFGNWTGEFKNLLKYRDQGTEIIYTLEEEELEEYYPTYPDSYHTVSVSDASGSETVNTVINTYWPYGDLKVSKTLADGATPKAKETEFTFSLTLLESDAPDAEYLQDKYPYVIYTASGEEKESGEIGNGDEFRLREGEYLLIHSDERDKGLPTGTHYIVTELYQNAFTQVSDNGSEGNIRSMKEKSAEFVNEYAAEGSASVALRKQLTGRDMLRGQFRFKLQEGTDSSGTVLSTAPNGAPETVAGVSTASVAFSPITYTQEDLKDSSGETLSSKTFIYTVSEVIPDTEHPGYKYDETKFYIKVTVSDEEGKGELETEVKYYSDAACTQELTSADTRTFVNEYEARGDLHFDVWKTLKHGELTAEAYQFELLAVTADPVEPGNPQTFTVGTSKEIKKNDEDYDSSSGEDLEGKVTFSNISFVLDQDHPIDGETYWYAVREIDESSTHTDVTYDDKILCFQVTVSDNGDGTLSFDQKTWELVSEGASGKYILRTESAEDPENPGTTIDTPVSVDPVFENSMKPGSLKVTKYTDGTGAADTTFRFRVVLTGEDIPTSVEEGLNVTIDTVGNVTNYEPPASSSGGE